MNLTYIGDPTNEVAKETISNKETSTSTTKEKIPDTQTNRKIDGQDRV